MPVPTAMPGVAGRKTPAARSTARKSLLLAGRVSRPCWARISRCHSRLSRVVWARRCLPIPASRWACGIPGWTLRRCLPRSTRRVPAGPQQRLKRVLACAWKFCSAVVNSCLRMPMPPCTPQASPMSWRLQAAAPMRWTEAWKRWLTPTRPCRMCRPPRTGSDSSAATVSPA